LGIRFADLRAAALTPAKGLCPLDPHQRGKTPFGNPFSGYFERTVTLWSMES
jgi:hypothetical protein